MKNRVKKLLALITMMTLVFSMTVNAGVDGSLAGEQVNVTSKAHLDQITDLSLAGNGVCEVDVQLQQSTGGTIAFSGGGTSGAVTATADSGYIFKGFRYNIINGVDEPDDAYDYKTVEGVKVFDPSKDTYDDGFKVEAVENDNVLGLTLSRVAGKKDTAHLETEIIVVVTADFAQTALVTIDGTILVREDGNYTEVSKAGYLDLKNVDAEGDFIKNIDLKNDGSVWSGELEIGTQVEFYFATDNPGYKAVDWKANLTSGKNKPNPRYRAVVTGNNKFSPTPVFEAVSTDNDDEETETVIFTVTTAGNGSGTITVDGVEKNSGDTVEVDEGTEVTLVAAAASGSTFGGWSTESDASVTTSTVTAVEGATYTATFNAESTTPDPTPQPTPAPVVNYTLTVEATEGGTVPGFLGTNTFGSGTVVNLGVTVEDGYEFVGWTGDVSDDKVTMNSDKTVVANFELIVEEEPVPEAPVEEPTEELEIEEILDEEITESAPIDVIEDEQLPQTGGIPMSALSVMGLALSGLGVKLRRRK